MSKNKKKHFFKVVYKDENDNKKVATLGFGADNYREDDSYKENLLNVVSYMVDDGGMWVDTTTLIPLHRILAFHPHTENGRKRPPQKSRQPRRNPPKQDDNIQNTEPTQ